MRRRDIRVAWRAVAPAAAAAAGHAARAAIQAAPGVGGVALLSYGAWLAWEPAGFMVAGALLLADRVATAFTRREAR